MTLIWFSILLPCSISVDSRLNMKFNLALMATATALSLLQTKIILILTCQS